MRCCGPYIFFFGVPWLVPAVYFGLDDGPNEKTRATLGGGQTRPRLRRVEGSQRRPFRRKTRRGVYPHLLALAALDSPLQAFAAIIRGKEADRCFLAPHQDCSLTGFLLGPVGTNLSPFLFDEPQNSVLSAELGEFSGIFWVAVVEEEDHCAPPDVGLRFISFLRPGLVPTSLTSLSYINSACRKSALSALFGLFFVAVAVVKEGRGGGGYPIQNEC